MTNVGTMRAWYDIGKEYIYWTVTQITDPLSEYPPDNHGAGITYPDIIYLSDFQLVNYVNPDRYTAGGDASFLIDMLWDAAITSSGYVVGISYDMPFTAKENNQLYSLSGVYPVAKLSYAQNSFIGIKNNEEKKFGYIPPSSYINYAQGISAGPDQIITGGVVGVYCETVAYPGETMYVSIDSPGVVVNVSPYGYGPYYQIPIGTAVEYKEAEDLAKVNVLLNFGPVLTPGL